MDVCKRKLQGRLLIAKLLVLIYESTQTSYHVIALIDNVPGVLRIKVLQRQKEQTNKQTHTIKISQ